jgi:hypothetical protein
LASLPRISYIFGVLKLLWFFNLAHNESFSVSLNDSDGTRSGKYYKQSMIITAFFWMQ